MIAIGAGVVADVALPQERGKYLGLFNMTSTFGPASESESTLRGSLARPRADVGSWASPGRCICGNSGLEVHLLVPHYLLFRRPRTLDIVRVTVVLPLVALVTAADPQPQLLPRDPPIFSR
jgi:hypothetical protein